MLFIRGNAMSGAPIMTGTSQFGTRTITNTSGLYLQPGAESRMLRLVALRVISEEPTQRKPFASPRASLLRFVATILFCVAVLRALLLREPEEEARHLGVARSRQEEALGSATRMV